MADTKSFSLIRSDSENADFISLVKLLDAELAMLDGKEHSFYAQYNKLDKIKHVVLAYENENVIGCGAIKEYERESMEVKRMYVLPENRNKGVASAILQELENWAKEMAYKNCLLETGKRQPDAIALYTKKGYSRIRNYGQYENVENSICFQKIF